MTETQARDEICRIGRSLFERGYVHATAGNISVQLGESEGGGTLITPTDACLGFLEPAQLAHLAPDGTQTRGLPASKTIALHRAVYRANALLGTHTRCIIHTHSTHCVALSLQAPWLDGQQPGPELLPPITPYFVMKVGHVPLIPYHRPGDPAVAELVAQRIEASRAAGAPVRAVMLDRLGPNVWHASPAEASGVLEELEETARLWLMARPAPLNADQIAELRQHFGARW